MSNTDKKIELSNKVYPYFYGISCDLLFYVAIDTIFLSIVKGYNEAQINFFTTFWVITILIFQPINLRIIKKIGNVKSIRLGVWVLLISSIIITFSNNYYISLIGFSLYEIAFIFKSMENVVLKRNLKHFNRENDFIKVQSKGATIYSFITMIISLIAGFLFTINNYLPMYLCIICCTVNVVLSYMLYESEDKTEKINKTSTKFKLSKIMIFILLSYATGYSVISLAQSNGKLFIQKDMLNLLGVETTSIYLVVVIAISRVIRVIGNLVFPKVHEKLKNKILYLTSISVILSIILILVGHTLSYSLIGIYIMCIGYYVYLAIRDPFQNYIKDIFLNNCEKHNQEKAITYMALSKNIEKFLFSLVITLTLLRFDLSVVFYMLLVLAIVEFYIALKLYKMIKEDN